MASKTEYPSVRCAPYIVSADGPRNWSSDQITKAQRFLLEGRTYVDVGRAIGKSKSAVMCANHEFWQISWRNWKPDEEARAKEMLSRRHTYAEVAAAVGRTEMAVERTNQSTWRIPYKRRHQVTCECKTCGRTFRLKRSRAEAPGGGQFC